MKINNISRMITKETKFKYVVTKKCINVFQ